MRAWAAARPASFELRGNGAKAWFGWPDDEEPERLRTAWFDAPDFPAQKAIAEQVQMRALETLPRIPFGQLFQPTAFRSDVRDIVKTAFRCSGGWVQGGVGVRRHAGAAVYSSEEIVYAYCVHMRRGVAASQTSKPPQRVGVREFRGNLTGFLRQARQGRSFLIMSHNQVLAEVGPPRQTERPPRCPGALRGKIRIAPDFDRLPADVLAAMEGE